MATTSEEGGVSLKTPTVSINTVFRRLGYFCIALGLPSVVIVTTCDSLWNRMYIFGIVAGIEFFILSIVYNNTNKVIRYLGWITFVSGVLILLYLLSMPGC